MNNTIHIYNPQPTPRNFIWCLPGLRQAYLVCGFVHGVVGLVKHLPALRAQLARWRMDSIAIQSQCQTGINRGSEETMEGNKGTARMR